MIKVVLGIAPLLGEELAKYVQDFFDPFLRGSIRETVFTCTIAKKKLKKEKFLDFAGD